MLIKVQDGVLLFFRQNIIDILHNATSQYHCISPYPKNRLDCENRLYFFYLYLLCIT